MFQVFLDFTLHNQEGPPSGHEQWLFRQWHFSHLYLAGLPLDFLERSQLRWIISGLQELWWNGVTAPERYDIFTQLLGLYGGAVRTRREADRKGKAAKQPGAMVPNTTIGRSSERDLGTPVTLEPEDAVQLTSADCPRCGDRLQLPEESKQGVKHLDEGWLQVSLYCPGCDQTKTYELKIADFVGAARRFCA